MKLLILHNFYKSRTIGGEDLVVSGEVKYLRSKLGEKNVHLFATHNDNVSIFKLIIAPLFPLVTLIKLFKVIKKNKITVVHAHNYFPLISPISFLIIKLSGAKLVHTLHNFRPWCLAGTFYRNNHGVCHLCVEKSPAYGVFYKCYKNSYIMSLYISFLFLMYRNVGLYSLPDKIFVLSNFQKNIIKSMNFFKQPVKIRSNILPSLIENDNGGVINTTTKSNYLFIGRIEESKGIKVLLNQWQKLPLDIHLTVIGDGPILDLVKKQYVLKNVTFLAKQDPAVVKDYIKKSKFLIQSSIWYETFGLTMFEAFEYRTPVIGFNVGTRPEFIKNTKNGFLCDEIDLSKVILDCERMNAVDYKIMQNYASESHAKYIRTLKQDLETCYEFS